MSFISQHIAHKNDTVDPSTGKKATYKGPIEHSPTETVQRFIQGRHVHVPRTPYEHQEYPKMLYKGEDTLVVPHKDAHAAADAEGWKESA